MMNETIKVLKNLSTLPGVPGNEKKVSQYIVSEIKSHVDEVKFDNLGSVIAIKGNQGPRVMIAGHMDEVGLLVTQITKEGFVKFQTFKSESLVSKSAKKLKKQKAIKELKKKVLKQEKIDKLKKEMLEKEKVERLQQQIIEQQKIEKMQAELRESELKQQKKPALEGEDEVKGGVNTGELNKYKLLIQQKIQQNVNQQLCGLDYITLEFRISLMPTGELLGQPKMTKSSKIKSCDDAVERAIIQSQPLPLPKDSGLFSKLKNLELKFHPNGVE